MLDATVAVLTKQWPQLGDHPSGVLAVGRLKETLQELVDSGLCGCLGGRDVVGEGDHQRQLVSGGEQDVGERLDEPGRDSARFGGASQHFFQHAQARLFLDLTPPTPPQFAAYLSEVTDGDLGAPTPCPDWSVGDLYVHMLAMNAEVAGVSPPEPADEPGPAMVGELRETT